jgi:hypothetical protein
MKTSRLLVVGALLLSASSAFGQGDDAAARMAKEEQRERDAASQHRQDQAFARLKSVNEQQRASEIVRRKGSVSFRPHPSLTRKDREAIFINPEDTKQFLTLLQQNHTGIVRIQSANVCDPSDKVVQASGNCPDNIVGKATSYSFRVADYRTEFFADILFKNDNLTTPGMYTKGIFSDLGDVDINSLGMTSDGVRQLSAFVPAATLAELQNQDRLVRMGMRIDNHIYKGEVELKENSTYVLRTIAYKGRMIRKVDGRKVNLLDSDTRKDMTIVFRSVRKHPDGSVTLVWKELDVKPAPKLILDETVLARGKN